MNIGMNIVERSDNGYYFMRIDYTIAFLYGGDLVTRDVWLKHYNVPLIEA